jgi:hypothetical protein
MEPTSTSHIKKGLVIAAVLISLDLLASFTALKNAAWFNMVPSLFLLAAAFANVLHHAYEMKGAVSFGNAFAFGFKTSAVVAVIMVLYSALALMLLFPHLKVEAYESALQALQADKNKLPEEAKQEARKYADNAFVPMRVSLALMSTLIVGAVGSVLGAAVCKKNASIN